MISIIRRSLPTLVNLSLKTEKPTRQIFRLGHHVALGGSTDTVARSLCESLRKGLNWDMLNRTYDSVTLNDRIIENVLLELREPLEAKLALSFFQWVAHSKKVTLGLRPYCLSIHILVHAHLTNDALALLHSLLKGNRESKTQEESSSRLVVANMLLNTYRITNSCPDVFELLVQTYSKLCMLETAFDVCCHLDEHGFSLSLKTFNTLVHVIQKSTDGSGFIWKVYEHMIQKRIYPNEVTVRVLIDALCKAGELQIYLNMIDRIHGKRCSPLIIVNTKLVYSMITEGKIQEGIVLLKRMLQMHMIIDTISYTLIVYAKLKSDGLNSATEIYGEMLSKGFHPNSFVYTLFIGAYCEEGMVQDALDLMKEMVDLSLQPYDDTYNFLITQLAKTGDLANSARVCEEMMENGMLPSSSAFDELVKKLCLTGNMKHANEMLTILIDKGFVPNLTIYNHLIEGYGREKDIEEVLKLYYEMEFRSLSQGLPIFTALIRTLCECGKLEEADKYLSIMKSRSLDPTICIYEPLIFGHLEHGNEGRAEQLYNEALQKGLKLSQPIRCTP